MIAGITQERLLFASDVRKCWLVRRDQNYDPYIVLNGKTALGNDGLDHLFIISESRVGVWLTSRQIKQKIAALQKKLLELRIEQLGDGEAVISADIIHLDELCRAVRARKRRRISEAERRRLKDISPLCSQDALYNLAGNASGLAHSASLGVGAPVTQEAQGNG